MIPVMRTINSGDLTLSQIRKENVMKSRSKIRLMNVVATCVSLWLLGTTPVVLAVLTPIQFLGTSINAVDVWFLTCTNAAIGTTARASVTDRGGVDGTHIYLHMANTATSSVLHRTQKTTAPDGGTSSTAIVETVETGGFRAARISVSRHIGGSTSETYTLRALCTTSAGTAAPHTLTLIRDQ
jgi:hypothetical protein